MNKGFKCECGKVWDFPTFVYAHWTVELVFTCLECDRQYTILEGEVELIEEKTDDANILVA